jgi:hypothetical protein
MELGDNVEFSMIEPALACYDSDQFLLFVYLEPFVVALLTLTFVKNSKLNIHHYIPLR